MTYTIETDTGSVVVDERYKPIEFPTREAAQERIDRMVDDPFTQMGEWKIKEHE